MPHTLTICDERPTGDILHHLELVIDRERLTVADLIRARVTAEGDTYNRRLSGLFHGLVQPTASEQTLNGYRMRSRKPIDAERETEIYSNRFAAHILRQHQFSMLAKTRGWAYSLLGAYDDGRLRVDPAPRSGRGPSGMYAAPSFQMTAWVHSADIRYATAGRKNPHAACTTCGARSCSETCWWGWRARVLLGYVRRAKRPPLLLTT